MGGSENLKGCLGDRGLHDTISRRLQYFKIGRDVGRADNVMFSMALVSKFVRPSILANLIRTACNVHPTARRFPKGGSHSACRFGCFAVGGGCSSLPLLSSRYRICLRDYWWSWYF